MQTGKKSESRSGTEQRLRAIEERLERLERAAYVSFSDIRKVADYAYRNVKFEEDADTVQRLGGMKPLSDNEALAAGLTLDDIVALKFKAKFLAKRIRRDVLAIAKFVADERKRDPVRARHRPAGTPTTPQEAEEEREVA